MSRLSRAVRELMSNPRGWVFAYDLFLVVALLALALVYVHYRDVEPFKNWLPEQYRVFANSMWLGALGGIVISLKGVYDHAGNPPWSDLYNLWHFGRPFSGAVTGLVTVLIFMVFNEGPSGGQLNRPVIYLAAFILGTQEARFFAFLAEIGRIIVQVPATLEKAAGLRVAAIEPTEGAAGATIVLAGQGFGAQVRVRLGEMTLLNPVVGPNGTTVAGVVPDLGGATRQVDVTVRNSDGTSVVLPDRFKFIVPQAG